MWWCNISLLPQFNVCNKWPNSNFWIWYLNLSAAEKIWQWNVVGTLDNNNIGILKELPINAWRYIDELILFS